MKKLIKIETEKDAKQFERKIWIYRSIIYRNVEFAFEKSNLQTEKYTSLIKALNIKNRKKRVEFIYDTACDEIDQNNEREKIDCKFIDGKCLNQYNTNKCNGCCRACPLQSDHGCTSRNLTCKMFFCDEIRKNYNVMTFKKLKILKALPLRSQLIVRDNLFLTRKSYINTLYWNSILIYGIKLAINLVKMIIYNIKKRKKQISKNNIAI